MLITIIFGTSIQNLKNAMKKNVFKLTILLLMVMSIISCQNELIEKTNNEISFSHLINFRGLKVNHRFSTPIEALEEVQNYTYIKKLYYDKRVVYHKRSESLNAYSSKEEIMPYKAIVEETEKSLIDYPYSEEEEMPFEKWEMIRNDFPTMTDEEIEEDIDLIDDYYSLNLNYEVITKVAQNQETGSSNTANDYYYGYNSLCVISRGILGNYNFTLGLYSLIKSSNLAKTYSNSAYPYLEDSNTKKDAYRHVIWNALLAKYYLTLSSKKQRIEFAKSVTDANETCSNNNLDSMEMDYHNNAIGRKLFNETAFFRRLWGIIVGLNTPSDTTLKNKTKILVENAKFIDAETINSINLTVFEIKNTDVNSVIYLVK